MSDLRDLYQELILDHGRKPRNFRIPENADGKANGHNPLCGDRISVGLCRHGDRVMDIGFEGAGCAICMAAASTMSEATKGKTVDEIRQISDGFVKMLVEGEGTVPTGLPSKLGVFIGVREFPMRVKCATLAWHTLEAALAGQVHASSESDGAAGKPSVLPRRNGS